MIQSPAVKPFNQALAESNLTSLRGNALEILQINVGKVCNQTCAHCHVDAGPRRTESMTEEIAEACLRFIEKTPTISALDITGGAPELNSNFRMLAKQSRDMNRKTISRSNLTVLLEQGQEDLAEFYATHHIEVIASMPCYQEDNVDKQRGRGVFEKSIKALRLLNSLGYGKGNPDLPLNLVYNPVGTSLPPDQQKLQLDYKRELKTRYGIEFDQLYTITNMPIARFEKYLKALKQYDQYIDQLIGAFNPAAAQNVMCKNMLSVSWDGKIYDCDFNQMLDMPLHGSDGTPFDIRNVSANDLLDRKILTGQHCYGCTAGAGSSCGGEVAKSTAK